MTAKQLQISVLALLLGSFISCSKQENYIYQEGLNRYLTEVFNRKIEDFEGNILYITPTDGCDYCVKQNLYLLTRTSNKHIVPILVNQTTDPEIIDLIEKTKKKYPEILSDAKHQIYFYETGYSKPLLLHIKNGEIIYSLLVEDDKIPEAEAYLKKHS